MRKMTRQYFDARKNKILEELSLPGAEYQICRRRDLSMSVSGISFMISLRSGASHHLAQNMDCVWSAFILNLW